MDYNGSPLNISVWKPSADDMERIAAGLPVFLYVTGSSMPPISIVTESPFGNIEEDILWDKVSKRPFTVYSQNQDIAGILNYCKNIGWEIEKELEVLRRAEENFFLFKDKVVSVISREEITEQYWDTHCYCFPESAPTLINHLFTYSVELGLMPSEFNTQL